MAKLYSKKKLAPQMILPKKETISFFTQLFKSIEYI
jgi:hypothetical protein